MRSDWLESFLVFSDTLNFTRAAEALHISQPALHVKISKLSEYVGKPLYHKSGRNLLLTAEGQQLQAFARDQSEQAASFLQILRNGSAVQDVCLSAGEGTFLYLLGDAISAFMSRSSHKLRIRTGTQSDVVKDVLSGEAHVGITPLDSVNESLACRPYSEVGQMLVMPAAHPLASKRKVGLKSLNGERLIVPSENRPHRILINRLLMDLKVDWNVSVEVDSWELMLNFVKHGMGLAIVNEYCQIPDELVAKPLPEFPVIQFQLIKRRHASDRWAVNELEAALIEHKDHWKNERKKCQ
ncbi:MAG: LysR family transcriptional regulator [Gammaproteobacteria bacterium]